MRAGNKGVAHVAPCAKAVKMNLMFTSGGNRPACSYFIFPVSGSKVLVVSKA